MSPAASAWDATAGSAPVAIKAAAVNAHGQNGFDLIRVGAAVMVLYGHSAALSGSEPGGFLGNPISTIGVKLFFVISGFLIARSWLADPQPVRFALRRALRIVPALACICLVTIVFLGPAFSSLPVRAYFANAGAWRYMWNVAFYPIYDLPGVFQHNIYPVAVNGSLWSLPAELAMYLLVPVLVGKDRDAARMFTMLSAAAFAAAGLYYVRIAPPTHVPVVYGSNLVSVLDVAAYFQLGTLFAVFGLQRFARPALSLGMLAGAAMLVGLFPGRGGPLPEILLLLLLPCATISVGTMHLRGAQTLLAAGDVSYGLYLYGFPVQQAVMAMSANRLGTIGEFVISLPLTMVLAILSWHFVERRALAWKPRRPAR